MKFTQNRHIPILTLFLLVIILGGLSITYNYSLLEKEIPIDNLSLKEDIQRLEARILERGASVHDSVLLAELYFQAVRETADPSYYKRIEELLSDIRHLDDSSGFADALGARLALGRHDFLSAFEHAKQAIRKNESRPLYYGLKGDAELELGLYAEAERSYQQMIDIRPDFNSWSRIFFIRSVHGDSKGARQALEQAIQSGSPFAENIAWGYTELGELLINDKPFQAREWFESALGLVSNYAPALDGLGHLAFLEGDYERAERFWRMAEEVLPLSIGYPMLLHEFYIWQGNEEKAHEYYERVLQGFKRERDAGINVDLEESLFLSDNQMRLRKALRLARRAFAERPSIESADALSWALYRNGRVEEAKSYRDMIFPLGNFNASILFHQGMIARSAGEIERARAYLADAHALDPYFSLQYVDVLNLLARN